MFFFYFKDEVGLIQVMDTMLGGLIWEAVFYVKVKHFP
jgi:hypothetical protein